MVPGRGIWIAIWYGILLLGILGFWASIYWGLQTRWKNIDELLRAVGTITASVGMLLLLHGVNGWAGEGLLVVALLGFMAAFVLGRRRPRRTPGGKEEAGSDAPSEPPPRNSA